MQVEALHLGKHSPQIDALRTRIVGCTCGWRTPPGTTDSDDAHVMHVAIASVAEGRQP